jgi:hypothetical protein
MVEGLPSSSTSTLSTGHTHSIGWTSLQFSVRTLPSQLEPSPEPIPQPTHWYPAAVMPLKTARNRAGAAPSLILPQSQGQTYGLDCNYLPPGCTMSSRQGSQERWRWPTHWKNTGWGTPWQPWRPPKIKLRVNIFLSASNLKRILWNGDCTKKLPMYCENACWQTVSVSPLFGTYASSWIARFG